MHEQAARQIAFFWVQERALSRLPRVGSRASPNAARLTSFYLPTQTPVILNRVARGEGSPLILGSFSRRPTLRVGARSIRMTGIAPIALLN